MTEAEMYTLDWVVLEDDIEETGNAALKQCKTKRLDQRERVGGKLKPLTQNCGLPLPSNPL